MFDLPIEILWNIILFLQNKDLVSFSLTCINNRKAVCTSKNNYGSIKLGKKDYKIFLEKVIPDNFLKIDLSWTKIIDCSILGNVHTLDLSGTNIVDCSMLRGLVKDLRE